METKMTLRLPNELKDKLKEIAEKENRSLHNLIITILIGYVEHYMK